jgi:hypothetical protein
MTVGEIVREYARTKQALQRVLSASPLLWLVIVIVIGRDPSVANGAYLENPAAGDRPRYGIDTGHIAAECKCRALAARRIPGVNRVRTQRR